MPLNLEAIRTPSGFLKICEMVITIIMMSVGEGVVGKYGYGDATRDFVVGGAMFLSIIVTPSLLVTYIQGQMEIQKTTFEVKLNIVMGIMMLVAGSLIINTYTSNQYFKQLDIRDAALATGSFGIINFIFYAIDTFFAYQNYTE